MGHLSGLPIFIKIAKLSSCVRMPERAGEDENSSGVVVRKRTWLIVVLST